MLDDTTDIVVIGGGPAGSCVASVLASWGYAVTLLTRPAPGKGRAESLPPSTRRLLAEVGVLRAVEGGGFLPTTGNTVWWAERDGHVEPFTGSSEVSGFQVYRPDFDRVLLDHAVACGVAVHPHATVGRWGVDSGGDAHVEYDEGELHSSVRARLLIDGSGRAGVLARQGLRRYEPGFRSQALLGVWRRPGGWRLPDDTHTTVETCEDGWAWSLPVSSDVRHVGLMVSAATGARAEKAGGLERVYLGELEHAPRHRELLVDATLLDVWACDASLYDAESYAGPAFLLVGDAGCAIDPLSSFGVKKAVASAWVGAVTAHTTLEHPGRQAMCEAFYNAWSRDVYASALAQSRSFAREAWTRHPRPFWESRAAGSDRPGAVPSLGALCRDADVERAFQTLKDGDAFEFRVADGLAFDTVGVIRGRELVPARAIRLPGVDEPVRFVDAVDLVRVMDVAIETRQVPDAFESYCRRATPAALPEFLSALSLLVGKGILRARHIC